MITRAMTVKDCDTVVSIHLRSFQGFFLTFLGPAFLSLLYRSILNDSTGIAIVAGEGDEVGGFVAGTTQPSGFYQRLLKRNLAGFFWASLGGFLRKPSVLPRLWRAFSMPGQASPAEDCATLMSIAVDPACQGQGIGKLLVRAFLEEARRRGSEHVSLTTDALKNDPANSFYRSLGFERVREYSTPEGRAMNEYLIHLV